MVLLMVLMSMGPLLTTPVVSAHAEPSGVTWPLEGSNDTGWVVLDAVGAVPETGQRATTEWDLSFAPGAELSNVTLEIRASGQNGMVIQEPQLIVDGMGTSLFDWRDWASLERPTASPPVRLTMGDSTRTATQGPDGTFHPMRKSPRW